MYDKIADALFTSGVPSEMRERGERREDQFLYIAADNLAEEILKLTVLDERVRKRLAESVKDLASYCWEDGWDTALVEVLKLIEKAEK